MNFVKISEDEWVNLDQVTDIFVGEDGGITLSLQGRASLLAEADYAKAILERIGQPLVLGDKFDELYVKLDEIYLTLRHINKDYT